MVENTAQRQASSGGVGVDAHDPEVLDRRRAGVVDRHLSPQPTRVASGRTGELGKKDQPIVVYCRSGARSGSAKRMLESAGFTAVYDLGAMSRW